MTSRINEARRILQEAGIPQKLQGAICCYALLALAGLGRRGEWAGASNEWMRIHDIIAFVNKSFSVKYAENSRETFRKQALHHFRAAAFVEDNGLATNSPGYRYRLTAEFRDVLRACGTPGWDAALRAFRARHQDLVSLYASKRSFAMVPVAINGNAISFSPGAHNLLKKKVLEEFAPRFAPAARRLYIGDAARKDRFCDNAALTALGIEISVHDKLPDIVLCDSARQWLFFVEAATSAGPMTAQRVLELRYLVHAAKIGCIFVTAFADFKTYRRFASSLAWDTEVWIADAPDHMIHLNGDRFLGPR